MRKVQANYRCNRNNIKPEGVCTKECRDEVDEGWVLFLFPPIVHHTYPTTTCMITQNLAYLLEHYLKIRDIEGGNIFR